MAVRHVAEIIVADGSNEQWAISRGNALNSRLTKMARAYAEQDDITLIGIKINGHIYTPDQVDGFQARLADTDVGFANPTDLLRKDI